MIKTRKLFVSTCVLLAFCLSCANIQPSSGRVVRVRDGDTVDVKGFDGSITTVRLFGVDCPEYGQSFGKEATAFVTSNCAQQMVTIEVVDLDKYGRTVGIVTLADGSVLNEQIIASGMGWWYKKFAPNRIKYATLERRAQQDRLGLWRQAAPMPPWEYRKNKRNSRNI